MKYIDTKLLDETSKRAKKSDRLRMNYNFHESFDAHAQRLLNALEPGTILSIHRHQHTAETYILLRGKIKILFYNDKREIIEEKVLNPLEGVYGVNIPKNTWHNPLAELKR